MKDNRELVLALEAPSAKMKLVNEKKHEEHWNILEIQQGQDIGEVVMLYFRNRTKSSENLNGQTQMAGIMSATGTILYPLLDEDDSLACDKGSCVINTIGGTFIIAEDGEVQQSGPLTVSYFGPSWDVIGGLVNGPLVAAGPVQIVVASCSHNSSEDGEKVL